MFQFYNILYIQIKNKSIFKFDDIIIRSIEFKSNTFRNKK